jgi:hypothetical protein
VAFTRMPLLNTLNDPFSTIAIALRRSLQGVSDLDLRSFFHLLKTEKDRTTINYGSKFTPATDLFVTSFVAQKLYNTGFGDVLGMPDFVRRPRLASGKGLCYMLPKSREGDVDVLMGLEENEYEGLKTDRVFMQFAEVIE